MIQSPLILCLGPTPTMQRTLVFEKLHIDEVNRARRVREFASGKAVNVGRVVQTLGEKAVVTGFLGGMRGQMLRDDLRTINLQDEMVEVAAPTRLCSTLIDQSQGMATELVEESAGVTADNWRQLDVVMERIGPQCAIWVFSGSLPPGGPTDAYAKWAPLAQQHGAKLIIDARGEALRLAMRQPDVIVKVNREELAATVATEFKSEAELISAMLAATPAAGAMIVTAGKEGSWVCDGKTVRHLSPPRIQAINPIGSGDSYAAGLAVGLLRKMDLFDACRLGTACAAANALTEDAGHAELVEINRLMKLIPAN
jgi:tagatose 6-phosphate kinase